MPQSLSEALGLAAAGARIVAGGTDVFPSLGDRPPPEDLLDLTRIPALSGISATPTGWRIGATSTWTQVLRAGLPPAFDGLKAAAREVGSVQIQNAGTVAGNLCNASAAADGVPPLLTLDAAVLIAGPDGERRLPLSAFLLGPRRTALLPGEIVAAIEIPAPPEAALGSFMKLGARKYLVISVAMVAAVVWPDGTGRIGGVRIAVGACSPVAQRLPALEAALVGRPLGLLSDATALAAFLSDPARYAPLAPIGDVRGSREYRLEAIPALVARALRAAGGAHG